MPLTPCAFVSALPIGQHLVLYLNFYSTCRSHSVWSHSPQASSLVPALLFPPRCLNLQWLGVLSVISHLEVFMVGTNPKGTRVSLGCFCGSQDMFKTGTIMERVCHWGFPAPLLHAGSCPPRLLFTLDLGELSVWVAQCAPRWAFQASSVMFLSVCFLIHFLCQTTYPLRWVLSHAKQFGKINRLIKKKKKNQVRPSPHFSK